MSLITQSNFETIKLSNDNRYICEDIAVFLFDFVENLRYGGELMAEQMKRLKRELAYKGAILDIYRDTMQLANGKTEEWDFVSHRMGAACVLPVLEDGRILMVRQYRNALERETLEIPAGCRDYVGEDTAVCAARELEEETGYRCEKIEFLLSLRTTVAFCDELVDVYLATGLKP